MAPLEKIKSFQSGARLDDWKKGKEKEGSNTSQIKSIVAGALMGVVSSTGGTQAQDTEGIDCFVEISGEEKLSSDLKECDLTTPRVFNVVYGYDYYEELLRGEGHDITDIDGFSKFVDDFGPILKHLGINDALMGGDIVAAMNLYSVHTKGINENMNEYANAYDDFIGPYTNPELDIIGILEENGYTYHGLI